MKHAKGWMFVVLDSFLFAGIFALLIIGYSMLTVVGAWNAITGKFKSIN